MTIERTAAASTSIRVLFVCLGNICRSPSAQGICEQKLQQRGWQNLVQTDSCGTAAFNLGKPPDPRAVAAAARRGYDISAQRARQIDDEDYANCQYLIVMDRVNLASVQAWAPTGYSGEIELLLNYTHNTEITGNSQIADPYYQHDSEFDQVIASLETGVEGLLNHIGHTHQLNRSAP